MSLKSPSVRWIPGALCAFSFAISTVEAREPYPLCGVDAERFMEFAFPDNGSMRLDRLAKWAMAPNLIVLSNQPDLKTEATLAFAQIAQEQAWRGAQLEFVSYKEPSEISLAARNYGFNNFFVIIDDGAHANGPRHADLRREVESILGPGDLVEGLFADAAVNQWTSVRVRTRPGSAADAAVSLIRPDLETKKLAPTLHALYYMGLAPAAAIVEPKEFLSAIIEQSNGSDGPKSKLSDFGRAFFAVLSDAKVAPGAAPEDFRPCTN